MFRVWLSLSHTNDFGRDYTLELGMKTTRPQASKVLFSQSPNHIFQGPESAQPPALHWMQGGRGQPHPSCPITAAITLQPDSAPAVYQKPPHVISLSQLTQVVTKGYPDPHDTIARNCRPNWVWSLGFPMLHPIPW